MSIYRGFSSYEFHNTKSFALTGVSLINSDLINHIFTRMGDRVKLPKFGTLIPELVFEPLDEEITDLCRSEVQKVLDFDPRVELLSLHITPDFETNKIVVKAELNYIEIGTIDLFEMGITFNN